MTPAPFSELLLETSQGRLAGLVRRKPGKPRVLCLHGWLDNAASFGTSIAFTDHFCVEDFTCLTHVIFEILPANVPRQVANVDSATLALRSRRKSMPLGIASVVVG